jgi:hypothetical protein
MSDILRNIKKTLIWVKNQFLNKFKSYYILKLNYRFKLNKNPLITEKFGTFSQNEEDVILHNIIRKIPDIPKTFIEFGVGDGLENNTVNLIPQFVGFWIGNEKIKLNPIYAEYVTYFERQLDLDNLPQIIDDIISFSKEKIGIISIDLDGNDFYITKQILKEKILRPIVFIVEYNSNHDDYYVMSYNSNHKWNGSNEYGASYKSYLKLFNENNFSPVGTNLTGVNAFFISNEYIDLFKYAQEFPNQLCNPKFKFFTNYRPIKDKNSIFISKIKEGNLES